MLSKTWNSFFRFLSFAQLNLSSSGQEFWKSRKSNKKTILASKIDISVYVNALPAHFQDSMSKEQKTDCESKMLSVENDENRKRYCYFCD